MESRINRRVCFTSILTLSLIQLDCGTALWRTPTVAANDTPLLTSMHVRFRDKGMNIIHKATKHVVATGKARNGLYELTTSTSEQVFMSQSSPQPSLLTENTTPVEP